jgi:hypothetical protein
MGREVRPNGRAIILDDSNDAFTTSSLNGFDGVLGLQMVQHLMCNIWAQGATKNLKTRLDLESWSGK